MNPDAQVIGQLFGAMNRRRTIDVMAHCSPQIEYTPAPAELTHGGAPYRGLVGIERYFAEVERTWDEMMSTPRRVHREGDALVVTGRIYARSRELGMRDLPAAWIFRLDPGFDRKVLSGTAYSNLNDAMRAVRERLG